MVWITQVLGTWSWYLLPPLASVLFLELGLTHTQFTLIFTAPLMVAILLNFLGGGFADRYGIRLAVAIGSFLFGIVGLARAFATGFGDMFVLMCLMGVAVAFAMPNLPKLVGIWFSPRQLGLASGIYVSAQAIGFSLGLFTGPLFGSWQSAFTYIGFVTLVAALLWALFGRSAPRGVEVEKTPIVAGVIRGFKSKNIRLVGVGFFLLLGAFTSLSGNLPKALEGVRGVTAETAGAIASLLPFGAAFGGILLPAISDRVGLRKPFIYAEAVIAAVCFYVAWLIAPGLDTVILTLVGGFFLGGLTTMLFTVLVEFPEIGNEHMGGAAALTMSLGNVGGWLLPLLVISPIIAAETVGAYNLGFLVAAALLAAIALPLFFTIETGTRRRILSRK